MSKFNPFDWPGDSIFDFNGDGELDFAEKAIRDVQHLRMMGLLDEDDSDSYDGSDDGFDFDDFEDEDYDSYDNDSLDDGFSSAGTIHIPLTFSVEVPQGEHESKDYPNARQKQAAGFWDTFGDDSAEGKRAAFIIGNASSIPAANYLTADGNFLYAQAIKDNFTIPCTLPEEDLEQEIDFWNIFRKLQRRDGALTLEVWDWCLQHFAPYAEYAVGVQYDLWHSVLNFLQCHGEDFLPQCIDYVAEHPAFLESLQKIYTSGNYAVYILIIQALKQHRAKVANALFNMEFEAAKSNWKDINLTMQSLVDACYCFDDPMAVKYVKNHYLARVNTIESDMVQDEIAGWNKTIDERIEWLVKNDKKYRFSYSNAWRTEVPDGSKWNLKPEDFGSKEEYLEQLHQAKGGWRDEFHDTDNLGLNTDDFETKADFVGAYNRRKFQLYAGKIPQSMLTPEELEDETVYHFCGVCFPNSNRVYHFLNDLPDIRIGDTVLVPMKGDFAACKVVSKTDCLAAAAPFPVNRCKKITKKVEE